MSSQKLSTLLIGLFVILQTNCNAKSVVAQSASNDNEYNNFEMALFQKIALDTPSNVIISPYSQKILLGMIMDGAVNETLDEIRTALRISSTEKPNSIASPTQMNRFNGSDDLNIANRIFLDKAYQINEEYRKKLQQDYSADVENVEKDNPEETAETINEWVKNETSGLIPSIIQESDITSDFLMALGNAIYFKGTWKNEFDEYLTNNRWFCKNEDELAIQEMMEIDDDERFYYGYFRESDAQVIDLPYKDGKHSMVIVLPRQRNGIGKLLNNIHRYSIQDLTSNMILRKIDLIIPKFTAEYSTDMVKILNSLNISRAFNEAAQLDNMINSGGPVKVSKILHKSKILVNEQGSEAAAVSSVKIILTSLDPVDPEVPILFKADHPFLYFIKDDMNNVLFAGKYTGP